MVEPDPTPTPPAVPPTIREVAELLARLRPMREAGWQVDPAELAAFQADKAALLDRITAHTITQTSGDTAADSGGVEDGSEARS
ncbi:hypothetical protein [Pseudonocardia sp. GCM10023141]|uniref:hypothetical protein n=1 Tax=Pseudonocardia sp. GCM10023141 TaxID=3252653 RepID=UPI0036178FE2